MQRNDETVFLDNFLMEKHEVTDEDGVKRKLYGMNFAVEELDFPGKISYAWNQSMDTVRLVRLSLQMLLSGKAGLADMSGPVGIVSVMSDVAAGSASWVDAMLDMLYFGAFIAINLAVMNLLPVPALDGGRVFGLLITVIIEKITRKKLDPKYEGYIHGIGMILLMCLMAIILFKDIFVMFVR